MTLHSKFEKGNVLDIYEKRSKAYKTIVVDEITGWTNIQGFAYRVYEIGEFKIYETYDELEFSQYIDVEAIYKDKKEYLKSKGE